MLSAGRYNINSRRINAAVSEDVGKLGDILFYAVKHPREKVAQVMRKDLFWVDVCLPAQGFHLAPDVCAAYRFSRSRYKNHAVFNILLRRVTEQFLFQLFYYKNRSGFRLTINNRLAAFCRFDGYILQLADTNTGCANRLQYKAQPLIMSALRGLQSRIYSAFVSSLSSGQKICC